MGSVYPHVDRVVNIGMVWSADVDGMFGRLGPACRVATISCDVDAFRVGHTRLESQAACSTFSKAPKDDNLRLQRF